MYVRLNFSLYCSIAHAGWNRFHFALVLVACGATEQAVEEQAEEVAEPPEDVAPDEAPGEAGLGVGEIEEAPAADKAGESYYDRALAGEFEGTVVTMTGPIGDEDVVKFN